MSDEYKVTQNSDGSYNVREVTSWIESSAGQRLIDGWARILSAGSDAAQERAAKAEAEKRQRFYKTQEYWNNIPDDKKILYRKRWMELSGVNAYKDDIGKVYAKLRDCHIELPDYVKTCSHDAFQGPNPKAAATNSKFLPINFDDSEKFKTAKKSSGVLFNNNILQHKKRLYTGIVLLAISAILLLLGACGFPFLGFSRGIMFLSFGLILAITGSALFFVARSEILDSVKKVKKLQNYNDKYYGEKYSAKNIADACSKPEAFKWFVYNEMNVPEYGKFFGTRWTRDNLPPLVCNDADKAILYAWERRRRIEDAEYFDCTTNTEWARNNPDTSIYSYSKAISGHYPNGMQYLFSIYYNHIANQVVRNKKIYSDPAPLYKKYFQTEENYGALINSIYGNNLERQILYNSIFENEKFKLTDVGNIAASYKTYYWPAVIPFTCGDLYGHLQWLKRRLAEDKEFVAMLPKLKYSPFLYILLNEFSQDEAPLSNSYSEVSIGLDLQWYIAQDFQKVLCENLHKHSAELDSILPFDDSGLENFDLNAAINKL